MATRINLITYHVPNIAVTNYSLNVRKACPHNVKLYTLLTRPEFKMEKIPYANLVLGSFPYFGGAVNLNRIFSRLAFKNFFNDLHKDQIGNFDFKFHYAAQYQVPLDNSTENVVTVHDIMPMKRGFKASVLEKRLLHKTLNIYRNYDNVIVDTNYVKKQLIKYGFSGKIDVIPYPLSNSFFPISDKVSLRKKIGLPLNKKLILSVSGFNPNKNIPLIKKLVDILPSEYKIVRVGGAIDQCINFSNLDYETLNALYNAADVLIQPSTDEGFGVPIIEGMKTKLPLVISDIEPFHEITQDFAFFSDPFNSESFKNKIIEAVNNSNELIDKAYERVKFFDFHNFKLRMTTFYENLQ